MWSIYCLAATLLPFLSLSSAASSSQPKVIVKNGTIVGRHSASYDQDFFLGIPYALPPTGARRFRPPQSYNETFHNLDASEYSPLCVGYGSDDVGYRVDEDCLTLNVIRPSNSANRKLPVAVWIHGGGYIEGGSGDRRYNVSFLVQEAAKTSRPFIAVSINYRLGPWGFLYSREVKGTGNTNLGLRDQRLALHWVQENIAAFGGDPKKVTLWGESAGAASVGLHLVAYGGRDDKLFSAAALESGSPIQYQAMNDTDYYQPMYNNLIKKVGCDNAVDSLDCLRHLSYNKLNGVLNTTSFNTSFAAPVVDGDIVPVYPSQLLSSGRFVKCPLLIGANSDEGTSFAPRIPILIPIQFILQLSGGHLNSSSINTLAKLYPDDPSQGAPFDSGNQTFPEDGPQYKRLAAYFGDYTFIANRRRTAEVYSAAGLPVYSYRFNAFPTQYPPDLGATHFTEVAFVFRNYDGLGYVSSAVNGTTIPGNPFAGGAGLKDLSADMSSRWISFFVNHDPNRGGSAKVKWPKYSDGKENIVFQTKQQKGKDTHVEKDDFRKDAIAFINSIPLQYAR